MNSLRILCLAARDAVEASAAAMGRMILRNFPGLSGA
jgi:hypothetical protein